MNNEAELDFEPRERHEDDYADGALTHDFPVDFKAKIAQALPQGIEPEKAQTIIAEAKTAWSPKVSESSPVTEAAKQFQPPPSADILLGEAATKSVDEVDELPKPTPMDSVDKKASAEAEAEAQAVLDAEKVASNRIADADKKAAVEREQDSARLMNAQADPATTKRPVTPSQQPIGNSVAASLAAVGSAAGGVIGGVAGGAVGFGTSLGKALNQSLRQSQGMTMAAVMPKISEYRADQIHARQKAYERAQDNLIADPVMRPLFEKIRQRAADAGVSAKTIIQEMRPNRPYADLHDEFRQCLSRSPNAQMQHAALNKELTGYMKQREKASKELGDVSPDDSPLTQKLRKSIFEADEKMEDLAAFTPLGENEKESHFDRLSSFFTRMMDAIKSAVSSLTNRGSKQHAETLSM